MAILLKKKNNNLGLFGGIVPSRPLRIDLTHPYAQKLDRFFYPVVSGMYDAVSGKLYDVSFTGAAAGTDRVTHTKHGRAIKAVGDTTQASIEQKTYATATPLSITWLAAKTSATSNNGMVCGDASSGANFIWQQSSSTGVVFRRSNADTAVTLTSVSNATLIPRTWVHDVDGNQERFQAFKYETTASYNPNDFIVNAIINGFSSSAFPYSGPFQFISFHEKSLNYDEVLEFQENPFEILKPEKEILYFIPAGGATTVPLTGQASTAAQGAPTVTGAASVSLTGQQSTTAQGTITVSITGAVNISLTGQASTAQQGTTTATGAATLTLSGQVSTLGQGTPTATGGALLALTGQEITTVQGTITVSVGGSVTIALSGQAGTVQQGAVSLITANIISVTGQASTARIGNITISEGGLWTIQADDGTTWTLQTNSSDTWTIQ